MKPPFVAAGVAGLIFVFANPAHARDSQFVFDTKGSLTVQAAATTAPPQILGQPQNQILAAGETAAFSIIVADPRALTYQWRFNGVDLTGSNGVSLVLGNVSAANEGEYRVVLTNPSGSVTSAPAFLFIDSDGDGLPDSWELARFGNLSQNPTGDFDHDGVSNLQEFLDGTDPTDPNSVRYHLTVLADGGSVAILPEKSSYTNGETVTLAASAGLSELFHAWLGDVITRDNPLTLVMTNNKTVEARFTTIAFTWTNVASGDWNTATNWKPNLAPGTNDSVVINATTLVTVTLNTPADCLDVTLSGTGLPVLTGSGSLTVRGNFSWTSGYATGTGRITLETGATLQIASALLSTRTLENRGTILLTGAAFDLDGGAVITNCAGALFDMQNAVTIGGGNVAARIDNAGTFRKSVSPGTTTINGSLSSMSFNNYGAVEIQSGTLTLAVGGTNSGSFSALAGTALNLSGGNVTAGVSSSITGAGQLIVNNGTTANLAGLVNVSGSNTFSGGTANLTGNYICTNNTLTISGSPGGIANFNGTGAVAPSVLNLSAGTLGGSNLVTVASVMNWTGGTMSGSGRSLLPPGATLHLALSSGSATMIGRALENGGTVLQTGTGSLELDSSAVITNRAGALFDVQGAGSFTSFVAPGRIDNAGTFRKSANAGVATVPGNVSFNNSGTVDLQAGTLSLLGGGTNSGSVTVPAGTLLNLGAGTYAADASSSITGAGQFTVSGFATVANLAGLVNVSGSNTFSGGTANLTGNYVCTNTTLTISGGTANFNGMGVVSPMLLNLSSGTLGGSKVVTVGSAMNWTGGTMSGSGRTTIGTGATLTVSGAGTPILNARTLENVGSAVLSSGLLGVSNGAVVTNSAGALFRADSEAANALGGGAANGRFDNAGTFRKSAGTGTTTVASGMKFTNYSTVDIRSGILAANGGFASSSNALLNCALGGTSAGTNYGQLQVAGTVTLSGGLSVDLLPGFSPATNDTFTVLTAGTRSGAFGSFSYPSNRVTMLLSNSPSSVVLRATDVLPIPQPVLLTPALAGTNVLLTWTATSNVTYRLEFKPDLSATNWSALPDDVTTFSNTASKLDSLIPSNHFYRVRVLP